MKVLLDTHTLIWFTEGSERLSTKAKSAIGDINNIKFISIVSLWEIVIKSSSNKLEFKQSLIEVNYFLSLNNIQTLTINTDHLNTLSGLPFHHKDPFDRLLIAQAISGKLAVISSDRHFSSYPVEVIW